MGVPDVRLWRREQAAKGRSLGPGPALRPVGRARIREKLSQAERRRGAWRAEEAPGLCELKGEEARSGNRRVVIDNTTGTARAGSHPLLNPIRRDGERGFRVSG